MKGVVMADKLSSVLIFLVMVFAVVAYGGFFGIVFHGTAEAIGLVADDELSKGIFLIGGVASIMWLIYSSR
jgi:hypothetical protein